jgi:hypothetical protein
MKGQKLDEEISSAFNSDQPIKAGKNKINSPLGNKTLLKYKSNDMNERAAQLNDAIRVVSKSDLPDIQKNMLLSNLYSNAKMYGELRQHLASEGRYSEFVEKKASEIMSNIASERGLDNIDMNQLMNMGKSYTSKGNAEKTMEVTNALSQMKDLFDLFGQYGAIADWNYRDFINSSWSSNGERKEKNYGQ